VSERLQVTVEGVRLVCHVSGAPDAPALVLLHGLGDDGGTWEVVGAEFAQYFRVLAIDLRGHGLSDWPGTYSFELMRDDVLGVLDELGLDRVNLLGHSMGGTVAYLIAEKEPGRIERLILEDTPPPGCPEARCGSSRPGTTCTPRSRPSSPPLSSASSSPDQPSRRDRPSTVTPNPCFR
jgi:pimeloyl-ACP methyl ester carboxylesterase